MSSGIGLRGAAYLMAILGAGVGVTAHGAVDGLEIARAHKAMSLHWDNVAHGSPWLSGPPPAWDAKQGLHLVDLRQGAVAIHVPAHAMLRVVGIDAASAPPVFAVSNGTGLAVRRDPLRGVDGQSWLLRTGSPRPCVIHLMPHDDGSGPQRHALFLARYEAPADAVAYRHDVALPGATVMVRRADQVSAQAYARLPAGDKVVARVRGPDRLMVEYRLAAQESPPTALPLLEVGLDGRSARVVRQLTGPETIAPVQVDGAWQASSRLEWVAFDVPAGEHTLELQATHGLLVRARAARDPDLLLPQLNFPQRWEGLPSATEVESLEEASVAAAESNEWRDIGRLAGERLRQQAKLLPGQRSVQAAADELTGQFTEFQDLAPATAGATRMRPILLAEPQPPDEPARHQIRGPVRSAALQAPTLARFQRVTGHELRFTLPRVTYPLRVRALVHAATAQGPLEVRYNTGHVSLLMPGMPRLPEQLLNLPPPTGMPEPLTPVAVVEWELPPGATSLSVRTLDGELDLAMQWAASTEYFLDDEFLAQRVAQGLANDGPQSQQLSAVRPLLRMLAAAHAQYVANIEQARPTAPALAGSMQDVQAQRAAQAARRESEPARAVALWQSALQASDPAVRAGALQGLARAMLAAGERFAAERLLRSHWIGTDPVLSRAAQEDLHALYAHEQDRAMQVSFTAAVAFKDASAYPVLSALLAAEGEDRMAILAGLSSPALELSSLMQSALRARLWQTFDALVQRLPEQRERHFWEAQRALAWGRDEEARALLTAAGRSDWETSVREARTIVQALQGTAQERSAVVGAWSSWQARHPGPRHWRQEPEALVQHAGSLVLRSVPLNLRSQWWQATEAQPMTAQVVGPARIRIEARPLHRQADSLLGGWLRARGAGQLWLMPFHQNQPAPGLDAEAPDVRAGAAVNREIDLPAGLHELRVDAGEVPIAARLFIERPALQLPMLAAPSPSHFRDEHGVAVRRVPTQDCGATRRCELMASGTDLQANKLELGEQFRPGLPPPAAMRDPLAGKLAAGDLEGGLALATDPQEKMRVLLWLAHTVPSARARALALGARVAGAHPTPEIRAQWERLSESSGWSVLPLVDRSAGLRRVEGIQGAPESPAARIRAALLAPLGPGELRLGADTRATLVYQERQVVPLRIELAMDDVPGLPALPLTVIIERNGQPWQTVRLEGTVASRTLDLRLPAGQQTVSVSLRQPYVNQFVRARFSGPVQPELTSTRDWHIATLAEPVRVTLAGPTAVRIDYLGADGVRSEERVFTERMSALILSPLPGQAETLYRIFRRQVDPVPSAGPPPRPNAYQPQAMAEAPAFWRTPVEPVLQEVRFIDDQPLSDARDHTLTARASFMRRRDSEATGGGATPPAEQFVETGATWRQRSNDGTLEKLADALVRVPTTGSPVLGMRLAADIQVPWRVTLPFPFTLEASLTGFAQHTPDGLGASLTGRLAASQTRELGSTLSHTPAVGVVARWFKLDAVMDPSRVDTDVFTRYMARHRRALNFSETLSWRPWRDSHLSAQLNIVTNPQFNLLHPHHLSGDLRWRQLLGATIVEAGVRATRYIADADLGRGTTRREWWLKAGTEWWLADGTRLELQTQLRHDASAGVWGGVELRWHWSGGRQLRDFAPSEIDFRALRSWRAPDSGNRIEER